MDHREHAEHADGLVGGFVVHFPSRLMRNTSFLSPVAIFPASQVEVQELPPGQTTSPRRGKLVGELGSRRIWSDHDALLCFVRFWKCLVGSSKIEYVVF